MKAMILAESQSGSLGPLTLDIPTAALPVAGKPLVARLLDYLEQQGVTEAVVSCSRWPHLVERAVEQRRGQMPVVVSLRGAATPDYHLLRELVSETDERFVVVSGDMVTDLDLRSALDRHVAWGAIATVVVTEVDPPCHFGEVTTDRTGAVVMFGSESLVLREGKRTACTGLYIIEPSALRYLPPDNNPDLTRELLTNLVELEMPVYGSWQSGYWQPIRSYDDYRAANVAVLSGAVCGMTPVGSEIAPGIWSSSTVVIDPGATIVPPIMIGPGCRVERDATVGPEAILGDDVRVERGALVRRSIALSGTKVGLATRLEDAVVRGNVYIRGSSPEPTYVNDRDVLETVEAPHVELAIRSTVDRLLALGALLCLFPLMLLVALLIRLDSPGPIFYSQLRVGQGKRVPPGQYPGRVFKLLKFRTMYEDADRRLQEVLAQNEYGDSPFVKIKDDPRITRLGGFLRASSLDELPQLINVVKGDMGLVGNRPLPLYEADQLDDDWQRIRFDAPAGITGLWQISGRSDLSAEERIVLDSYYALTRSLWSDVRILMLTIPALLARRGAR